MSLLGYVPPERLITKCNFLKIRKSYENFQNSFDSSMVNEVLEFQEGNNQNLETVLSNLS